MAIVDRDSVILWSKMQTYLLSSLRKIMSPLEQKAYFLLGEFRVPLLQCNRLYVQVLCGSEDVTLLESGLRELVQKNMILWLLLFL